MAAPSWQPDHRCCAGALDGMSGRFRGVTVFEGDGTPEGAVPGPPGSLFLGVSDPAAAFIKISGTGPTGWSSWRRFRNSHAGGICKQIPASTLSMYLGRDLSAPFR
jgi:hypothetical protein